MAVLHFYTNLLQIQGKVVLRYVSCVLVTILCMTDESQTIVGDCNGSKQASNETYRITFDFNVFSPDRWRHSVLIKLNQ